MTANGNALTFVYGSNGHPMAVMYNYTNYYYYVTNALGDVIAIVDNSGTEVVTYNYDAWGNIEWMLHNIAYAGASILGLDSFRASAESVDIGRTVFADPHEGVMGHALKIPCLVFLFPVAVVDLFINGGYR